MKNIFKKVFFTLASMSLLSGMSVFASSNIISNTPPSMTNETGAVVIQALPTESASLKEALIKGNHIEIKGSFRDGNTADPNLYLFELKPYEDSIGGRTDYISKISKTAEIGYKIDLLEGIKDTRLYSKFVVAVKKDDKFYEISNKLHVTNPEIIAKSKLPFQNSTSKKGLLIELHMLKDAFELGVKHAIVNIDFNQIMGEGIKYEYEGKTYHFNAVAVDGYDKTISAMSGKSMQVTAVVLNAWNDRTKELIYPGLKKSNSAHYYGFNTSTKEGYETTRALASFLAERYSGENFNYGRVSNWIIGNEVNNNANWNYMGAMDLDKYVAEFERSFRVFYTAIKAKSQNARVFFSTDYDWNYKKENKLKYSAKAFVDKFNEQIRERGNIDWNLAYHPYPIPLTSANFWDDTQTGMISADANSQVINFANLNVLTDYLQNENFRNSKGAVRRVILSEQGFTSKTPDGKDDTNLQAAAFAYAYYITDANPYIDAFILSRQVDSAVEVKDALAFGLWGIDMSAPNKVIATNRKKIWSVFRNIDNKNQSLSQTEFAKKIIGISKWSDVIPNFRYKNLEK